MTTRVVLAKCSRGRGPCRARFVLEADACGETLVTYSHHDPASGQMVPNAAPTPTPLVEAVPYLARCIAHRSSFYGKPVRVTMSAGPCGDVCRAATGAECKCSCGGSNHGADA